jgi:hypothetical protein
MGIGCLVVVESVDQLANWMDKPRLFRHHNKLFARIKLRNRCRYRYRHRLHRTRAIFACYYCLIFKAPFACLHNQPIYPAVEPGHLFQILMARTVVGLFSSAAEAQFAVERLLAAGFQHHNLNVATQDTLRAEHLPAEAEPPTEPLGTGFIRFFTDIFAGSSTDDTQAHIAATRPDSAVVTVNAATEAEADRARLTLDTNGAIDVYKQAASPSTPTPADNIVDLEGRLSRVRDDDELDANGLTTH